MPTNSHARPVVATAAVTVTGSATLLIAARIGRSSGVLQALDTNTEAVYVGDSAVTSSTGIKLVPGQPFAIGEAAYYGIRVTANQEVRVIEEYKG